MRAPYRRFLLYLQGAEDLSESTMKQYERTLRRWDTWLKAVELTPWRVSTDDAIAYMAQVKRDFSPGYVRHILAQLRAFYNWAVLNGRTEKNPFAPIRGPRQTQKVPSVLTPQEVAALIGVFNKNTPQDIRDRAILETLYAGGMRVSELCAMNIDEVMPGENAVLIKERKTRKERIQPVYASAITTIEAWVRWARPYYVRDDDKPLFLGEQGERLHRNRVVDAIHRAKRRVGMTKRVTPHTFRHSYATHLLRNGVDIRRVQELLGHANIQNTMIYTHIEAPDLREAMKRHPGANAFREVVERV